MVLNDTLYINPFKESYTISKCRYYITNIKLNYSKGAVKESNSYHLIDETIPQSQSFIIKAIPGNYNSITFMLGVDSLHNVSGAQSGALDPLNDMFWTWNSGYVMAKLEGISPFSKLQNNIFEYHIGGFKGLNKVVKNITLNFPLNKKLLVQKAGIHEILIQADINEWWKGGLDLKIAVNPSITSPGYIAKMISENYTKMFVVKKVSE